MIGPANLPESIAIGDLLAKCMTLNGTCKTHRLPNLWNPLIFSGSVGLFGCPKPSKSGILTRERNEKSNQQPYPRTSSFVRASGSSNRFSNRLANLRNAANEPNERGTPTIKDTILWRRDFRARALSLPSCNPGSPLLVPVCVCVWGQLFVFALDLD